MESGQKAALFRMTAGLILLGGAVLFSGCSQSSQIAWTRSLKEAKAKASDSRKVIIADIYTDWCGWCKQMDVKTWAHPAVIQENRSFVFLKLNAETEPDGIAMQKRFGIESYPTVLLLDSTGEEFDRLEGYLPGEQFLERLRNTLADPESLGNLRTQEAREPQNLALRFKLGKKLLSRSAYAEAQTRFEQIVQQDSENKSQLADSALFYLALCQASQTQTDASLATINRLRNNYPESKLAPRAILFSGEVLLRSGRREAAKSRIEDFLKAYPEHQLADQAKKLLAEI